MSNCHTAQENPMEERIESKAESTRDRPQAATEPKEQPPAAGGGAPASGDDVDDLPTAERSEAEILPDGESSKVASVDLQVKKL